MVAYLGLIVLILLRLISGHQAMSQVWLSWDKFRHYLVFGLGIILFYVLQVALNALTGLGPGRLSPTLPTPPGMSTAAFMALAGVQSVLLAPILAIVLGFGEEYGWRGYLQSELVKLGRVRGVLLVGLI